MIEINLLPGKKKKAPGAGMKLSMPDFRGLIAQVKDPWLIGAIAAWVVVGGGGWGSPRVARGRGQQKGPVTMGGDWTGAPAVRVTIDGRTVDIQAYTTFLRQLAASPWFTDVTPASSQTVIEADRPVTSFTVTVSYRIADSVYIRTVPLVQSLR